MNTIKADKDKRLRLRVMRAGDRYYPETFTRDKIILLRVEPPPTKRKLSREQALRAIESSPLRFETSYDDLRRVTREP